MNPCDTATNIETWNDLAPYTWDSLPQESWLDFNTNTSVWDVPALPALLTIWRDPNDR